MSDNRHTYMNTWGDPLTLITYCLQPRDAATGVGGLLHLPYRLLGRSSWSACMYYIHMYVSQCHSITIYICMPAVEHNNVSLLYINVCTYNSIVKAMVRYKMYYRLTYESHNIVLCIVCIMSI